MKLFETLKTEKKGNIVTVFLNRPNASNAINMQMVNDLSEVIDLVEDANDISVLVLRGLNGLFSSGIDLRDFSLEKPPDIYGLQKWEQMCRQIENLNKFTIAAIEGECIGGGFQMVLLCDARIADKRSFFQFHEVKLGFLPGMAAFRLAKYIGLGRAKNLILTGCKLKADKAQEWGILDQICDTVDFEKTLQDTIDRLLPFHPVALEMSRRLINESFGDSYENFFGHFLVAQERCIKSEAFHNLIVKASKSCVLDE